MDVYEDGVEVWMFLSAYCVWSELSVPSGELFFKKTLDIRGQRSSFF